MSVKFQDNSIKVKEAITKAANSFLIEAISELQAQTVKNTKVYTGRTKVSIRIHIDPTEMEAQVGSNYENFIWEELGTGEFAVNGDGRKGGWKYQNPITGKWYSTRGKRPRRMLFNAFNTKKKVIINRAREIFGEMK